MNELPDLQIDVWYGARQTFGHLGQTQRWINVLGRVAPADQVALLRYQVDGGEWKTLSVGPNRRRLVAAGDFNVEIDREALSEGDHLLRIAAQDRSGRDITRDVEIEYRRGVVWPLPCRIEWSHGPAGVAQVVDGLWTSQDGWLRTAEIGYDRTVAIGDIDWRDYEITVPITVHRLDQSVVGYPSNGPGFGIIVRWQGHVDWSKPKRCSVLRRLLRPHKILGPAAEQPRRGWWPLGAQGWYGWLPGKGYRLSLQVNDGHIIAEEERSLTLKATYVWRMRVRSENGGPSRYSLKVWPAAEAEPTEWTLAGRGVPGELGRGAVLLVAHHADVSFGEIVADRVHD